MAQEGPESPWKKGENGADCQEGERDGSGDAGKRKYLSVHTICQEGGKNV
jgi:hypothetical protein